MTTSGRTINNHHPLTPRPKIIDMIQSHLNIRKGQKVSVQLSLCTDGMDGSAIGSIVNSSTGNRQLVKYSIGRRTKEEFKYRRELTLLVS